VSGILASAASTTSANPPAQSAAWTSRPRGDITGFDSFATNFLQNTVIWNVDIPRPTYAIWIGNNWRVNDALTVNLGIRHDLDQGEITAFACVYLWSRNAGDLPAQKINEEQARGKKVARLRVLWLRVFDKGDAFRLLSAAKQVANAGRRVELTAV